MSIGDPDLASQAPADPTQRPPSDPPGADLEDALQPALDRALAHLARHQGQAGSWPGDYGGPMFLLPMYVGVTHMVGELPEPHVQRDMVRYLRRHQNPDGGYGLHVEGHSHVFTTALAYVALRLLEVAPSDPQLQSARQWLNAHGGPLAAAPWGKFFLALLNLYDYAGLHPLLPELWLLPEALPVHPSRLWCHCRMVYLPMSYLYGKRASTEVSDLTRALRSELYDEPYDRIDWLAARDRIAPTDDYAGTSLLMQAINPLMARYERHANPRLRERALRFVLEQIRFEDRNTQYICIGPINKLLHTLIWHWERPDGPEVRAHLDQLPDYLYQAHDGTKMQGYNSSELWDTAFAAQAVSVAAGRRAKDVLERAHRFIEQTQVRQDVPDRERCYRDPSKGGWPFSTRPHGWPITDCTAEGLKACLALDAWVSEPLPLARRLDAVDLMLWWQNADGGWATYERTRGPAWLEQLNPSGCFADIMIDYSYVECTSACMQALAAFRTQHPGWRDAAIARALERGQAFLLAAQRPDGSFEGSWGICFTYGTWFGVLGLLAAGMPRSHPAIQAACDFLEAKQLADGGWGETAESCRARRYVHTESGQAVMTSWALLALIAGGRGQGGSVARGAGFLLGRQRPDGSWPQEHIAGMFNKTSAIHYDNYLKVFPLWALGAFAQSKLGDSKVSAGLANR